MSKKFLWILPVAAGAYYLYSRTISVDKADPTTAKLVVSKWGEQVDRTINLYKRNLKGSNLVHFSAIDSGLIMSIIFVESRGNEKAIGAAGEVGLMQIMPNNIPVLSGHVEDFIKNGRDLFAAGWGGGEAWRPEDNIFLGVQNLWNEVYLMLVQEKATQPDLDRAVRGYNVGFGTAKKSPDAGFEYLQKVRAAQNTIFAILGGG